MHEGLDELARRYGWSAEERAAVERTLQSAGSNHTMAGPDDLSLPSAMPGPQPTLAPAPTDLSPPSRPSSDPELASMETLQRGVRPPSERTRNHEDTRQPLPLPPRYEDLGLIGRGGAGEVRRVRDLKMRRVLAMKVLKMRHMDSAGVKARFVEEAQLTAQLEHPGIVPVYDMGLLADGRVFFTMKVVAGRTLGEIIRSVHRASDDERWGTSEDGFTLRRLIDAFHSACEAVAYAHARGVTHRDIKPDNIMVGMFGEVLMLDWGLAKILGSPSPTLDELVEPITTDRNEQGRHHTRMGRVAGTPSYMPPEQARGQHDLIGPAADVYALGAVLYEILSGHPPYQGAPLQVLKQVLDGKPEPLGNRRASDGATPSVFLGLEDPAEPSTGRAMPAELVELCERAMEREAPKRPQNAELIAREVQDWLEGTKRLAQAREVVEQARRLRPQAARLRERVEVLRAEAKALLAEIPDWAGVSRKRPAWRRQDEASEIERQADAVEQEVLQTLQVALTLAPDLAEAHADLAHHYQHVHAAAEAAGDTRGAARAERLLRYHDRPREFADYLDGKGAFTLRCNPPGARVRLSRYTLQDRRLVPVAVSSPKVRVAPIDRLALDRGRWLAELEGPACATVRLPFVLDRGSDWDGRPPGVRHHELRLPRVSELGPGEVFVAEGYARLGGDPDAPHGLPPRTLWVDSFVIQRFPITNRQYLTFLNDLVDQGLTDEALAAVPRERAAAGQAPPIYGQDKAGHFQIVPDADGDLWDPDWPVFMVDLACAVAYARWLREKTGLPWRLPGELEWEKAARGVDGRFYPWGDTLDPSWACTQATHQGRPLPVRVDTFPIDESPYGVRGMCGGMRDWCADVWRPEGPELDGDRVIPPGLPTPEAQDRVVCRGGSWGSDARDARLAGRYAISTFGRSPFLSFRLARSV